MDDRWFRLGDHGRYAAYLFGTRRLRTIFVLLLVIVGVLHGVMACLGAFMNTGTASIWTSIFVAVFFGVSALCCFLVAMILSEKSGRTARFLSPIKTPVDAEQPALPSTFVEKTIETVPAVPLKPVSPPTAELIVPEEPPASKPAVPVVVVRKPPKSDSLRCPKCRSTQLTANKKGFGGGKALAGAVLVGPLGLLGGTIGSGKVKITCLKCGNVFKPGTGK